VFISDTSMTVDPSAIKPAQLADASKLASAIVDAGAATLLNNAGGVTMRLLTIGQRELPMAVCEAGYRRASFLSPTRHYLHYPIEEINKRSRYWNQHGLWTVLWPLKFVMWAGTMDQVVYPNHWLTVSRPGLGLEPSEIESMIARLTRAYPRHAIVVSNIVPAVCLQNYKALAHAGCDMIPSRRVWFFDPARPMAGKKFKNTRTKLNRLKRLQLKTADAATTDKTFLHQRADAMSNAYYSLNIHRHSRLNPQYTDNFFRIMLDSELVAAKGWCDRDDELSCFTLTTVVSNQVVSAIAAHRSAELEPGVRSIQLLSGNHIELARRTQGMLHWGGGADWYKYHLGAIPAQEFDAVYTRHLSPRRRLPWWILKRFRHCRGPMSFSWDKSPPRT